MCEFPCGVSGPLCPSCRQSLQKQELIEFEFEAFVEKK